MAHERLAGGALVRRACAPGCDRGWALAVVAPCEAVCAGEWLLTDSVIQWPGLARGDEWVQAVAERRECGARWTTWDPCPIDSWRHVVVAVGCVGRLTRCSRQMSPRVATCRRAGASARQCDLTLRRRTRDSGVVRCAVRPLQTHS